MACRTPRSPFSSTSSRTPEGGTKVTHKQDFNAHASGTDFRHCADQINMNPEIVSAPGPDVQTAMESLATYVAGVDDALFVSIGDGYATGTYTIGTGGINTLEEAFAAAFADTHVQNGGYVVLKAGTYSATSTIPVPSGVTIMGEPGAVINARIAGTVAADYLFEIAKADLTHRFLLGHETTYVTTVWSEHSAKTTVISGLTIVSNLNRESGRGFPAAPVIAVSRGAIARIENCSILGQCSATAYDFDLHAIGTVGRQSALETRLEVSNCFIDGFSSIISYSPYYGEEDYLYVHDCNFRYMGTDSSSNDGYKYAISSTLCNINVENNISYGMNDNTIGYGAEGFFYFLDNTPATLVGTDKSVVSFKGNSGGLGDDATPRELLLNFVNTDNLKSTDLYRGGVDRGNDWGNVWRSSSFYIVVGTGESTETGALSMGDINGPNALDLIRQRYYEGADATGNYSSPKVYLLPGTHVITTNLDSTNMSIEGVGYNNGAYITAGEIPIISCEMTSGSIVDDWGRYKLMLNGDCKNFWIQGNTDNSVEFYDKPSIIENILFKIPVNTSGNTFTFRKCTFYGTNPAAYMVYAEIPYSGGTRVPCVFERCLFTRQGYALAISQSSSLTYNYPVQVEINNCIFEREGAGDPIISATSGHATLEDHYININLQEEYSKISFSGCQISLTNKVGTNGYLPISQTLIDAGTVESAVYLKAGSVSVVDCDCDGPDQAETADNGDLLPFFHIDFTGKCIVDNSVFRASYPMYISGNLETTKFTGSPLVSVTGSKFRHYQRDHGFDTYATLTMNLPEIYNYFNTSDTTADFISQFSNVNIDKCLFEQRITTSYSANKKVDKITSTDFHKFHGLGIDAEGWNVNITNNYIYASHPDYECKADAVYLRNSYNAGVLSSTYYNWDSAANFVGNTIVLQSEQAQSTTPANYGQSNRSVCLFTDCGTLNIQNNNLSFVNSNQSAVAVEYYFNIIGWALIVSKLSKAITVSNNNFIRMGDIPDWGIKLITDVYSGVEPLITVINNAFDKNTTNSSNERKFIINATNTADTDTFTYISRIYPNGTIGYSIASAPTVNYDTNSSWAKTVIYSGDQN